MDIKAKEAAEYSRQREQKAKAQGQEEHNA